MEAVTRSSLEREVWGSNLGPVKLDTVLPTARHRYDISSNGAVLPGRNDAEMGPANSLHAPAYYNEYSERFDLIWCQKPHFNSEPIKLNKQKKHHRNFRQQTDKVRKF